MAKRRYKVYKNKSTLQLYLTIPKTYAELVKIRSGSIVLWDYDKDNDWLIIKGTKRSGGSK